MATDAGGAPITGKDDVRDGAGESPTEIRVESSFPYNRSGRCPNCDAPIAGKYCQECGQSVKSGRDYSVRQFVGEAFSDYVGVEGKVWRTLRVLVFSPGQLTLDFYRGRRTSYVKPFSLFLAVNVVFFVLAVSRGIYDFTLAEYLDFTPPSTELTAELVRAALASSGATYESYEAAFNGNSDALRQGLIILLVPGFAVASWLLNLRARRFFLQHLVASIHFFTFYWLFVAIVDPPITRLLELAGLWADPILLPINMGSAAIYLMIAQRRLYDEGLLLGAVKVVVLIAVTFLLLRSYRILLFFASYALT